MSKINVTPIRATNDQHAQHGSGSGGDGMEARLAKLESDVGHIQSDVKEIKTDIKELRKDAKDDFRLLFGVIIATTLALAGLLAKGFHWL